MATCTPVYRLPVIEGRDRGCDAAESLCSLALNIEEQLTRFDGIIGRTFTAIPMAKITISEPQTIQASVLTTDTAIKFDTVLEDSDNMVNLSQSNIFITPRNTGLFIVRCYVETATSTEPLASYQFQLRWQGPPGNVVTTLPVPAFNPTIGWNDVTTPAQSMKYVLRGSFRATYPESQVWATVTYGATPATVRGSITRAELDIEWVSD